jgi:hypothetical protein
VCGYAGWEEVGEPEHRIYGQQLQALEPVRPSVAGAWRAISTDRSTIKTRPTGKVVAQSAAATRSPTRARRVTPPTTLPIRDAVRVTAPVVSRAVGRHRFLGRRRSLETSATRGCPPLPVFPRHT